METAAESIPVLITRKGGTTKSIAWRATGANRSATSERKTTAVNTSREIAASSLDCVENPRAVEFGINKETARFTSETEVSSVVGRVGAHAPGNNANMFGSVLPIQNGRWGCVQVSRVHRNPVNLPDQRDTARRTRIRPKALIVARTSRTTSCGRC